eukprot:801193_1
MGIYSDCKKAMNDKPGSTLTALEREVLYARIRAFSVRVQYCIWNVAATVLLYLFNHSLLNKYIDAGDVYKIAIFHAFQAISIIAYFLTSLSNPGYIELNENGNALFFDANDGLHGDEDEKEQEKGRDRRCVAEAWNKNIIIDPNNAPFNFCWRCKFVRPIRSKHCYDCDRCIAKFDHHCPMVGNCVGGKNHRFFVVFLLTESVVIVWCFQLSLLDLYGKYHNIISGHNHGEHIQLNLSLVFRLLFFLSMFFAMFIVIGLSGFHCYLSTSNQTTYEMVKPHILEKWVKEENKRKHKYHKKKHKRKHPNKDDYEYRAVAVDILSEESSDYYRTNQNNMISFDAGYIRNIKLFWTAKLNVRWITPLNCILKDPESEDEEYDDNDQSQWSFSSLRSLTQ